jgi:hypothetical protein
MSEFVLDPRPFFQILHNLIRQDGLDYDPDNTAASVEWFRTNSSILRKVLTTAEFGVVMVFYTHWDKHKVAPDRKMMDELIHSKTQPKTLLDTMAEYDVHAEDLEQVPHLNLDMYLDQRKQDYEKCKLARSLETASQITLSSVTMNDKAKTVYAGPRDAMKYLHERFQSGILIDDATGSKGGDTAELGASAVMMRVSRASEGFSNAIPFCRPIDQVMSIGPGEPIKWVGLLGYTNQRKSTLLFTFAYNAAQAGYKVLFVPLENTVDEAWTRIYWLHAHHLGLSAQLPNLADAVNPRRVRREHLDVLQTVIEDFKSSGMKIDVYDANNWGAVASQANAYMDEPYDLLCLDYLAKLDTPGERDQKEAIRGVYLKAHEMSLRYAEGRGLVVMTPIQSGKSHEKTAAEPEPLIDRGIYRPGDIGAIDYHTDAGRGLDALIGVWSGEGYREHGIVRVSCVKSRQQYFNPFFMTVDGPSQYMQVISNHDALSILAGDYRSKADDKPGPMSQEIDKWVDVV